MKKLIILFLLLSILVTNSSIAKAIEKKPNNLDAEFNFDEEYQDNNIDYQVEYQVYDPLEGLNRKIFAFNEVVDKNIVLPVVRRYHKHIPKLVRKSIHNFFSNISVPFSVINSVIQGNGHNAMASFSSFIINSTIGVGGLFDVAGHKKIKYNKEDFGQSFGKYGFGPGAYLIIPILGPSNVRDFSGFAVKQFINPLAINSLKVGGSEDLINDELLISFTMLESIDIREGLIEVIDDVRKNSLDPYSTIRSAYLQKRASLIIQ